MNTNTKEKVKELFDQGKSNKEISILLNINASTTHYHLKSFKETDLKNKYDWVLIKEFYDKGNTALLCRQKFGCSKATWDLAVKRKDIIPRKRERLLIDNHLVFGSSISSSSLKKRIFKENLLKNECVICKQAPEWYGQKLTMVLDHINGNPKDNRLENLRILCPNCNSQTPTFCKGHKHKKQPDKFCKTCFIKISKQSTHCRKCSLINIRNNLIINNRKFNPSKEELQKLVWEMPTTKVAKLFNVSDKAVEKRCKILGVNKPPRGYWAKSASKGQHGNY